MVIIFTQHIETILMAKNSVKTPASIYFVDSILSCKLIQDIIKQEIYVTYIILQQEYSDYIMNDCKTGDNSDIPGLIIEQLGCCAIVNTCKGY